MGTMHVHLHLSSSKMLSNVQLLRKQLLQQDACKLYVGTIPGDLSEKAMLAELRAYDIMPFLVLYRPRMARSGVQSG